MTKRPVMVLVRVALVAAFASVSVPAFAQSETVEYYGLDALGSVSAIFDQQGKVVSRMDYGPFGDNLRAAIKFPTEQFAQLGRDAESGQDYAQARNYSAQRGRFNRVDPISAGLLEPQRWNRYIYSLNSPLSYLDVSGLDPTSRYGPLDSGFCDAEFSMDDCGGGELLPSQFGLGFGGDYARAQQLGYSPDMSPTVWGGLLEFQLNVAVSLAQSSGSADTVRPAVATSETFRLEDGTKLEAGDSFSQLANDIWNRTSALTRPKIYGEFLMLNLANTGEAAALGWVGRAASAPGGKLLNYLFGRDGQGLLNGRLTGDVIRIGYGWDGPAAGGVGVFRVVIGSRRGVPLPNGGMVPVHWHRNLFTSLRGMR